MKFCLFAIFSAALASTDVAHAQAARVWPAPQIALPAPIVDGNSPSFWRNGEVQVYTSTGSLLQMRGSNFEALTSVEPPTADTVHRPLWIEAVWQDEDGTVYAWYHHEPGGLCDGKLTAPEIGALVSEDGGQSFRDLGIVLASGYPVNCTALNGFFGGGHGDFSVIPDRDRNYFYFLFTNYSGPAEFQGIGLARMAFENRSDPVGTVFKLHDGEWSEPGVGGEVTPVLPAATGWDQSRTDSYWGPAVHWNTYLGKYVVLLNHACCEPGWPQEGIYVLFAPDLADPSGWTAPAKILEADSVDFAPAYYPQAVGLDAGESDTLAGEFPRLFIKGISSWYLVFSPDGVWEDGAVGCTPEDLLSRGNGRGDASGIDPKCGPGSGSSGLPGANPVDALRKAQGMAAK